MSRVVFLPYKEPRSLYTLLRPDFTEDAEGITLTAGNLSVGKEHITVTLEDPGTLTIKAEKTERKRFLWLIPIGTERFKSTFTYDLARFKLTAKVTAQGATATCKDHTLVVRLPKRTNETKDTFPMAIAVEG